MIKKFWQKVLLLKIVRLKYEILIGFSYISCSCDIFLVVMTNNNRIIYINLLFSITLVYVFKCFWVNKWLIVIYSIKINLI